MSDHRVLWYHDFHDAHLAAHQLELEGHRAEVFENGYSNLPWTTFGFQILVFRDGLEEGAEPEEESNERPDDSPKHLLLILASAVAVLMLATVFRQGEHPAEIDRAPFDHNGLLALLACLLVAPPVGAFLQVRYDRHRAGVGRMFIVLGWCMLLVMHPLALLLALPLIFQGRSDGDRD